MSDLRYPVGPYQSRTELTPAERRQGISWVWLMPVLAVLVALGMVWQTYANRGPMITVTFPSASGIEF